MTVLWLTGLSGSGKTTIGHSLVENLKKHEKVVMLDGDELRKGINSDLGFSIKDRAENIRRVAHTAKLLSDKGFLVITTLISPTRNSREQARKIIGKNFIETFIKTDIETCIKRDVKGLYKKALAGEIKEFTGISSVYEEPENPELILDTQNFTVEECVNKVISFLVNKELVKFKDDEGWLKINYGGQKLNLTQGQKAIFIGRWQPFHKGHQELIWNKLKNNIPVLIMVRDIPDDEKNPFTTAQVVDMVKKVYESKKDLVQVMIIPDIESVNFGRGVGYEVNEFVPHKAIEEISATKIRESLNEKTDKWIKMVPEKVIKSLKEHLDKKGE